MRVHDMRIGPRIYLCACVSVCPYFYFLTFSYSLCVTIIYLAEKHRLTKFVMFNEFGFRRVNMVLYQPSIRNYVAVVV